LRVRRTVSYAIASTRLSSTRRWATRRKVQPLLHEAAAHALDGVAAHTGGGGDRGVEAAGLPGRRIGQQQDAGVLERAGGMRAAVQELLQMLPLSRGEGDTIAFRSHAPSMPAPYHNGQGGRDGVLSR